jgi:hypothetical protein
MAPNSSPGEADDHLYTVLRYVERNPLRANLVGQSVWFVGVAAADSRAFRCVVVRELAGSGNGRGRTL